MNRFEECLVFVLAREGGFSDHPADRGGATNFGVTQRVYDQYRAAKKQELASVRYISPDEVADIYRTNYWRPVCADRLPPPVDLAVFDAAVNHGVKQASKFLQRALGVGDDGIIGAQTLYAMDKDAKAGWAVGVAENIVAQRESFYESLVAHNPSQSVFLKGWKNRLAHLSDTFNIA